MAQCLHWVTDAYNEFLVHGTLSSERINRLQMVYDKLRTSESMAHDSGTQTMSNLSTMIGTSITTAMQPPSLLNMNIPPPMSACAVPTIGVAEPNALPTFDVAEPNPLSVAAPGHERQRSRSRSVEKPLLPLFDATDGGHFVRDKSPDSRESLANSVTMEFGSEQGGGAYSPFDSPFDLSDAKAKSADPHNGRTSDVGLGRIQMQGTFMKDHDTAEVLPSFSPFGSVASDQSRAKPPPPPPPVLSPQDILAARISDEIALVEVLVRIQFELATLGDLPAEDAAAAGVVDTSGPSTPPEVPAPLQSTPTTTTALSVPNSLLGNTSGLPALPLPSSMQEMIDQSATPTSATPSTTTVSAAITQTTFSPSGNMPPSAVTIKSRMPCTPPIVPTSATSIPAEGKKPGTVQGSVSTSASKATTSTMTKPQSSSSSQPAESNKQAETSTAAHNQQPRKSSAATKSDAENKSKSKDSSEQVYIARLCQ